MVIGVLNLKGGVGKTFTTATTARILNELNKKVLMIDIDKQANLGSYWKVPDDFRKRCNVLFAMKKGKNYLKKCIYEINDNLHILPSTLDLVEFESVFATHYGKELVLKEIIHPHLSKKYDYILIDCPPDINVLVRSAILSCDIIVHPVNLDINSLEGLIKTKGAIELLGKSSLKKEMRLNGIFVLPIRFEGVLSTFEKKFLKVFHKEFSDLKFLKMITNDPSKVKKLITLKEIPRGKLLKDYRNIVRELLNHVQEK